MYRVHVLCHRTYTYYVIEHAHMYLSGSELTPIFMESGENRTNLEMYDIGVLFERENIRTCSV